MRHTRKRLGKAHPYLAELGARFAGSDFAGRLVPRFPTAQATSQADTPCADPAAPSGSSPGGAVFSHFTESGPQVATGPDKTVPAGASAAGTVTLSDHTLILLRAVASYEQCSNDDAMALALAAYATKIGAGPLARAVLDERERVAAAGGAFDDVPDDLGDLPEFVRRDQVRGASLNGTREAHGRDKSFQGMRR